MENNKTPVLYTEEQLMARLKFFIGVCLALTLTGIVFVVLYSLIFVTQPLNAISPIDQKFFELIVPIATFLTGTLSGIMLAGGDKDAQKQALTAANAGWSQPPTPTAPPTPPSGGFGSAASSRAFTPAPSWGTTPTSSSGFGSANSFSSPSPAAGGFGTEVVIGFGGKPAPVQPEQPPI